MSQYYSIFITIAILINPIQKISGAQDYNGNLIIKNKFVFNNTSTNSYIQSVMKNTVNFDGMLDQAFGNLGTTTAPIIIDYNSGVSLALQPDGKIVIAGTYTNGGSNHFCAARFLPDGQLDTTFGGQNGQAQGNTYVLPTFGNLGVDIARSVALQSDGKIIISGTSNNSHFTAARLLPNGQLDISFGGQDGQNPGTVSVAIIDGTNVCWAMAVQADDKILLGGYTFIGAGNVFAVARLLADGHIDESFGGQNGQPAGTFYLTETIANPGVGTDDQCRSLAIQEDGKIIMGGYSATTANDGGGDSRFAAVRLLTNGSLDETFGGTNSIPGTTYMVSTISGGLGDQCYSTLLQPDGKILMGGATGSYASQNTDVQNPRFAIARFLSDGQLDLTFGGQSGQNQGSMYIDQIISGGTGDECHSLALQSDGKILMGGFTRLDNHLLHFAAARITSKGVFDESFGGVTSQAGTVWIATPNIINILPAPLVLQSSNKIVMGGAQIDPANVLCLIQLINPMTLKNYQISYAGVGTDLYS